MTAVPAPSDPKAASTGRGRGPAGRRRPDDAHWVAIAGLPAMGPARLRLLHDALTGEEAWQLLRRGRARALPTLADRLGRHGEAVEEQWRTAAATVDVAEVWERHSAIGVCVDDDPDMPSRLATDVEPPIVLFADGDIEALEGPTVAIVGTRRCTRPGAEIAFAFGEACARAGARVVSGLAVGIDLAAHRGALAAGPGAAPPIAIVGSGLDVVYPPRSRTVWAEVADRGVVLSEYPLGTEPARWRFPARNRLVAAVADVVVVIESPDQGGSMYTVDQALERGRTLLAVPGSIRSAASAGSNRLLAQGASVAAHVDDVLLALGLPPTDVRRDLAEEDRRPRPVGDAQRVLNLMGWEPATLDQLAARTGLGLGALAAAVARLEVDGWVDAADGRVERRPA